MFNWVTIIIASISTFVMTKVFSRHKCPAQKELDRVNEHNDLVQHQLFFEKERNKITEKTLTLELQKYEYENYKKENAIHYDYL